MAYPKAVISLVASGLWVSKKGSRIFMKLVTFIELGDPFPFPNHGGPDLSFHDLHKRCVCVCVNHYAEDVIMTLHLLRVQTLHQCISLDAQKLSILI